MIKQECRHSAMEQMVGSPGKLLHCLMHACENVQKGGPNSYASEQRRDFAMVKARD